MEELVSARIFFHLVSGAGNFFRAVYTFFWPFVLHDFFDCKGFAEIFSLKSSTPPPSKIKWSTP